jgi:ribonuclease HIII
LIVKVQKLFIQLKSQKTQNIHEHILYLYKQETTIYCVFSGKTTIQQDKNGNWAGNFHGELPNNRY